MKLKVFLISPCDIEQKIFFHGNDEVGKQCEENPFPKQTISVDRKTP